MTENEALEKHKEDCKKCWDKACEHNIQCLQKKDIEVYEELQKYRAIGTIDEFKALKEKNEPKKAIGKRKYDEAYCPACNEVISDGEFWALDEYVHHCNYCGQAVKSVNWQ